jgi:hypothetical protein
MQGKKLKIILSLVVIAVLALAGAWALNYANNDNNQPTSGVSQQESIATSLINSSDDGKTVTYVGVEGQTSLSLLKQYATVETQEYPGLGEYVVSINGVASDSTNNYWAFYINGEAAQVGAGDYTTKADDDIEWRLEDVSTFDQ